MASSPKKTALNMLAMAVGMFMLAYASVPLYRLFCQVTGFGGTTQRAVHAPGVVGERRFTIRFNADTMPELSWKFAPGEREKTVRLGEQSLTHYVAENLEPRAVKGRAIYNVVPNEAGKYFEKIACFCFEEQTLGPRQKVNMPVSFFIDPAIENDPALKDLHTITLSYTFFPSRE